MLSLYAFVTVQVTTAALPDREDLYKALPLCPVPPYSEVGIVQFYMSTDGHQWGGPFSFEYHGA